MAEISNPHDSFFKRLFGDLAVATDFMQCYLPPEILARLDLTTLRLELESFVDPELRQHFSDLLFSVKTTGQAPVFVYLLLEHKSAPEPWVAFQLLRYIVKFWERQREQGCARLPLVIPLVFYHGAEPWNVPRNLSALYEPADLGDWQKYAVDFEYDLRDVSLRGGGEIKGQPKLRAGLQLLRYIYSDELEQRLSEIFQNLRAMSLPEALEYARSLLAYLSSARHKVKKQKVREVMENVFPQPEFNREALFIQEFIEEGKHLGLYSMTVLLLENNVGALDEMTREEIRALPNERLQNLGLASPKLTTLAELQQWLRDNAVIV
jgi:hypothetical protein